MLSKQVDIKREFLEKNIIEYSNGTFEDFLNQRKRMQRCSLSQYDEFTSYTYEIIWKRYKTICTQKRCE